MTEKEEHIVEAIWGSDFSKGWKSSEIKHEHRFCIRHVPIKNNRVVLQLAKTKKAGILKF